MNYPFVKCLHPVQVQTLKGVTLVRCGKCAACENSKKSDLQMRVLLEAKKHKHSYFLTLTYDDEHLPLFTAQEALENYYDSPIDAGAIRLHNGDYINDPKTTDYDEQKLLFSRGAWFCNQERISSSYTSSQLTAHNFKSRFGIAFDSDDVLGMSVTESGSILGMMYEYHRYLGRCKQNAISQRYSARVTSWYSQTSRTLLTLPLLFYQDLQNFMKRLRKQLYKIDNDEKVRYYAIGEYGTRSLRPHWHIVLHTNSDKIAKYFASTQRKVDALTTATSEFYTNCIVSSCWQFGYSTISKADAKVGGYVSNYVVGSSLLPKILSKLAPQKTFHSIGYGLPYSKEQSLEMLSKRDYDNFTQFQYIDENDGNRVKSRPLWRSYYNQFFPSFTGINELPSDEVYRVLKIYPKLVAHFFETNVTVLARKLHYLFNAVPYDPLNFTIEEQEIASFFDWLRKPKVSTFEHILYESKKFLSTAAYFGVSSKKFFDIYTDFHQWQEKQCLAQHYINCCSDDIYKQDYYKIYGAALGFRENLFDRYSFITSFSFFKRDSEIKSFARIKHREIYEQIKNI